MLDKAKEAAAQKELSAIVKAYGLSYVHNPGGCELRGKGYGSCQIHCCSDVDDLATVKAWLDIGGNHS